MTHLLLAKRTRHSGSNSKDSGTLLSEALEARVITPKRKGKIHSNYLTINWGLSSLDHHVDNILNKPECVGIAVNKLLTFMAFKEHDVPRPTFIVDKEMALRYIQDGHKIVCRTLLCSSSGKGIVIATNKEELVNAPLYTLLYKKKREFRVHVPSDHFDSMFYIQQKRRKTSESLANSNINLDERSKYIRNLANGWIYSDISESLTSHEYELLCNIALSAINSLDLHFGAVDIMETEDGMKVLEVNTAPGLKNTKTLEFYTKEFSKYK